MSKAKHNVISYSKVDTSRIGFTDLEDNDRIPSQKIGYVRYDHQKNGERQFDIQTPEIKLDNYGIPDGDGPYYKTTSSRAFVKIPLEVNNMVKGESDEERTKRSSKLTKFRKSLEAIDKYMEDNKEKFFGSAKTAKKYTYQPIVRKPQEKDVDSDSDSDSDNDNDNDNKETVTVQRPLYMKAKIPIQWETDNVTLDIYRSNKEGTSEVEVDGSHTQLTDVQTLDQLRKHVGYMRDVRFVLHACKLWASKQASNGQETRKYGITFKVRRVEVQQWLGGSTNDTEEDGVLFANSDDEDQVVTKFVESAKKHFENPEDAEDSDDSDDDDSEEEEPVVEVKKRGRKAKSKKSEL